MLVNTGDGKGKSTAAFGVVMRAVARDWQVAVVQFLKSGEWHVGEEDVARRLGVDWWALGEGFTWDSEDLTAGPGGRAGGVGAGQVASSTRASTGSSCSTRSPTR